MKAKIKPEEPKERDVMMPLWKDRKILHPDHAHELEQKTALNEFEHKHPKELAEEKAYESYKRDHHLRAAASHFAGMKAARASGDKEEAKKHQAMYSLHMNELGHDPTGPMPHEIENHLATKSEPFYRFQAHPADGLLFKKPLKT